MRDFRTDRAGTRATRGRPRWRAICTALGEETPEQSREARRDAKDVVRLLAERKY